MIRFLELDILDSVYTFKFNFIFSPFFKKYFGHELVNNKGEIKNHNVNIELNYKFSLFSIEPKIVIKKLNQRICYIPIIKIFQALFFSIVQTVNKHSITNGLFEYFVYIIRISFLEPLERRSNLNNYPLIHSAVLKNRYSKKAILVIAPSKGGKSTTAAMLEKYGLQVVGDNYAFFNGQYVFTVPECKRSGEQKRFKFSFFGKDVLDAPQAISLRVETIILLHFSATFSCEEITITNLIENLLKIYVSENEGAFARTDDKIAIKHQYQFLASNIDSRIKLWKIERTDPFTYTEKTLLDVLNNKISLH